MKGKSHINKKLNLKVVCYCIGVDLFGQPLYCIHEIIE